MVEFNSKLADRVIEAYADLDELTLEECEGLGLARYDECGDMMSVLNGDGNLRTGETPYLGRLRDDAFRLHKYPKEFRDALSGDDGAKALHARLRNLIGPDYLGNPDPVVRVKAAQALDRMGPLAEDARPALEAALEDENSLVRNWAAGALGGIGLDDSAALALIAALKAGDAWMCEWIAEAFQTGSTESDLSPGTKEKAASALIEAFEKDWPTIPRDEDAGVNCKSAAARALGPIGPVTPDVLPALLKALNHKAARIRVYAAVGLAEIGRVAPKDVVPALVRRLKKEKNKSVLIDIIRALAKIGPEAKPAIPALIRKLRYHRSHAVRFDAAWALGRIDLMSPGVIPALIRVLLNDKDAWVRRSAAHVLAARPVRRDIVRALAKAYMSGDEGVAQSITSAISMRVLPDDADALIAALEEREWSVRYCSIVFLSHIKPSPPQIAIPPLRAALQDKDEKVRKAAQDVLSWLDPE